MSDLLVPVNQYDSEVLDSSCSSSEADEEQLLSSRHQSINAHQRAPKDRYKLVYLIFYLLGIGTLLPWNMFITAKDYFNYQLRNTSLPSSDYNKDGAETHYQISYESSVAMASMVPSIVMQLINTSLAGRVSMTKRLVSSMIVMLIMFIVTLVLTKFDASDWQTEFYATTLGCVVVLSAASALLQSSLFGLVGQFPQVYTQAIMGGMGLGGVFATVADIVTLAIGSDPASSAFYFFLSAIVVVLMALVAFLGLSRLEYARFYRTAHKQVMLEAFNNPKTSLISEYAKLIKQLWHFEMSVMLVFLVTLTVFPATTASVQSVNKGNGSIWTGKYFLPLYCFLVFNVGDLVGRTVAGWINVPRPSLLIPLFSWLRIVFIPLFVLCNAQPRNSLPVVFNSDVYPVIIMAFFALSNGYLSTQALMIAPTLVERSKAEMAGTIMSVCMTFGLSLGSGLSYALVIAVKSL